MEAEQDFRQEILNKAQEQSKKSWADWRKAKDRAERCKEYVTVLPDLEGLPLMNTEVGSDVWPIYLTFPLDFEVEKEVVRRFLEAGWKQLHDYTIIGEKRKKIEFRHAQFGWLYWDLNVSFRTDVPEATCVLQKVGEKENVSKVPVYEVVCAEAEAEPTWVGE